MQFLPWLRAQVPNYRELLGKLFLFSMVGGFELSFHQQYPSEGKSPHFSGGESGGRWEEEIQAGSGFQNLAKLPQCVVTRKIEILQLKRGFSNTVWCRKPVFQSILRGERKRILTWGLTLLPQEAKKVCVPGFRKPGRVKLF